ncbi:MAG TPA: hypothetical protein VMR50_13815 [Myxococcota bacterium]|nr:hypothetical protein [Myxococcota bacterium]
MAIKCKVCDSGTLSRKRKYRLSGPAVFIGYVLLIPSVFGVLLGGLMLVASGGVGVAAPTAARTAMVEQLQRADIPQPIIEEVVATNDVSSSSLVQLTSAQVEAIDSAKLARSAGATGAAAGAVIAGGVSIFLMVASLCSGLLGWLLTMKKRVLQCGDCEAVVQAS